ncbi:MAG TPA: PP2C family protein-serine/threonine phosphatase [Candidatus Obscuribacterales bacterium]
MRVPDTTGTEETSQPSTKHGEITSSVAQNLYREAELITLGVGGAIADTIEDPRDKLPELGLSFASGSALSVMSRLGARGKFIAAGIGVAMTAKLSYDEITGKRWSTFGRALTDTWRSADNMERNITATKNSIGFFVVDMGVGLAGMKLSSLAMSRFAPPAALTADAVRRAEFDRGKALRALEDRFENPAQFTKHTGGKLDLTSYSKPAQPGEPRGDLLRVDSTPEGNILLTAMDVEGHGVAAAKKAVEIHSIIDKNLSRTKGKSASEVLALLDEKIPSGDELSVTAAMMIYNPRTHKLRTATASSELAFAIRANGRVRQLDAKQGGLPLGNKMYAMLPGKDDVISLRKGDTVVMVSDGVFDRFGYGNVKEFISFLRKAGPRPEAIRRGILRKPPPPTGADDTSFIIFRRP